MTIIPFFISARQCTNKCIFCNTRITVGPDVRPLTPDIIASETENFLRQKPLCTPVQIAFYGGNFTGLVASEQESLLGAAFRFVKPSQVDSIRVSTRPDYIDKVTVDRLKAYSVKTVELGVESLCDRVLRLAERGHTAEEAMRAVYLLRHCGFEVIMHLMVGLPGEGRDDFTQTLDRAVSLGPDGIRVHPTLVLRDTALSRQFRDGRYEPLSLEEAAFRCKLAIAACDRARIPVIRMGLHVTEEMTRAGAIISGPFHPAFRSLVESDMFLDMALYLIEENHPAGHVEFSVSPRDMDLFRGWRSRNVKPIRDKIGPDFTIVQDEHQDRGTLTFRSGGRIARAARRDFPFHAQGV